MSKMKTILIELLVGVAAFIYGGTMKANASDDAVQLVPTNSGNNTRRVDEGNGVICYVSYAVGISCAKK